MELPDLDPQQSFLYMMLERIQALEKRESDRHIVSDIMQVRASDAVYIRFAAARHKVANMIVDAMKRGEFRVKFFATDLTEEEYMSIIDDLKRRDFTVTVVDKMEYLADIKMLNIEWTTPSSTNGCERTTP